MTEMPDLNGSVLVLVLMLAYAIYRMTRGDDKE
mgnify:CR=1 FL=1